MPSYIEQREIWTGVTDALLTHSLTTLKDRATQLLIKYKSGALVTQCLRMQQEEKLRQFAPIKEGSQVATKMRV